MNRGDRFPAGFFEDENTSGPALEMHEIQPVLSNQTMHKQIQVDGKKDVLADYPGYLADPVMIRKIVFAGRKYQQLDILVFFELFLNFVNMPSDSAFPGKEIKGKDSNAQFFYIFVCHGRLFRRF